MKYEYMVTAFIPKIIGCGNSDVGWTPERCKQFQDFLNFHASNGWKLHSKDYRSVLKFIGCSGKSNGHQLVCTFERVVNA